MPNPQFTKPWHGIARESIQWNPTIIEDACIGCGTCVTGCSRLVYRYDYERQKAVVVDPLNCMVGCTTCANTCPTHAIRFPSLSTVFALEGRPEVRHAIEDDLVARRDQLAWHDVVPHPEKTIEMVVHHIERIGDDTVILSLIPKSVCDCLSQFIPGQYLHLMPPQSGWIARAYSIGNAPHEDGSIELHIRRVKEGRMSEWIFRELKEGDTILARGPMGSFTLRSSLQAPLIFVAGGTGFAPIKAMVEQRLALDSDSTISLYWGVSTREDLYALDTLESWVKRHPNVHITLAISHGEALEGLPLGIEQRLANIIDVLSEEGSDLTGYDAYVAGSPSMIPLAIDTLLEHGIKRDSIAVDSFGLS